MNNSRFSLWFLYISGVLSVGIMIVMLGIPGLFIDSQTVSKLNLDLHYISALAATDHECGHCGVNEQDRPWHLARPFVR